MGRHQKADKRGETRGAVVLACNTDPDTHSEQESEIRKNRITRSGHRTPSQEIGLPYTKQQPGNRQNGNRQHQRPTQLLKSGKS
jgi:hypothetical protein